MSILLNTLKKWEKILISIVAVLVVVPSIVNSIGDIWVAIQGLPVGEKEKINATLFKKHFKETPKVSEQFIVDGDLGKLAMSMDVYSNGDMFVDYGMFTQWFPFKYEITKAPEFSLISKAYAWSIKSPLIDLKNKEVLADTKEIEHRMISNTEIERIRILADGTKEKQIININTGEVLKVETIISQKSDSNVSSTKIKVIDIKSK